MKGKRADLPFAFTAALSPLLAVVACCTQEERSSPSDTHAAELEDPGS